MRIEAGIDAAASDDERAAPVRELPTQRDAVGQDVRARRQPRDRHEQRVPLVGHPAARAKRSAQQLHGRQAAERTVHVIEHQPSRGSASSALSNRISSTTTPRIHERLVPPRELDERRLGQGSVVIGAAEAPRPRARIPRGQRKLEILVERPSRDGDTPGGCRRAPSPGNSPSTTRLRVPSVGDRPAEDVGVAFRMLQIGIRMQLQEVELQRGIVPRPQIMQSRAADRRQRACMRVHQLARRGSPAPRARRTAADATRAS